MSFHILHVCIFFFLLHKFTINKYIEWLSFMKDMTKFDFSYSCIDGDKYPWSESNFEIVLHLLSMRSKITRLQSSCNMFTTSENQLRISWYLH